MSAAELVGRVIWPIGLVIGAVVAAVYLAAWQADCRRADCWCQGRHNRAGERR